MEFDYSRKFGIDVPGFGGLNSFGIERIKEVSGKETTEVLLKIALEDKKVIILTNEIENMPDISEEKIQKQNETKNRIMKK